MVLKKGNSMIKNKIMFMGMDIPKEVETIMKQVEEKENNPFDEKAFNAGVNFVIGILKMICEDDGEHVVVHIPNQEIGTELIYDDLKKIDFCKSCTMEVEM